MRGPYRADDGRTYWLIGDDTRVYEPDPVTNFDIGMAMSFSTDDVSFLREEPPEAVEAPAPNYQALRIKL